MEILAYLLSVAVLATLVFTLVFITKGIKTKDDKALRKTYFTRAGLAFCAYALLSVLRLWAEGRLG